MISVSTCAPACPHSKVSDHDFLDCHWDIGISGYLRSPLADIRDGCLSGYYLNKIIFILFRGSFTSLLNTAGGPDTYTHVHILYKNIWQFLTDQRHIFPPSSFTFQFIHHVIYRCCPHWWWYLREQHLVRKLTAFNALSCAHQLDIVLASRSEMQQLVSPSYHLKITRLSPRHGWSTSRVSHCRPLLDRCRSWQDTSRPPRQRCCTSHLSTDVDPIIVSKQPYPRANTSLQEILCPKYGKRQKTCRVCQE